MPTPVGHALAGLTTAWIAETLVPMLRRPASDTGRRVKFAALGGGLAVACAALAAAPDLDILTSSHRAFSHSLGATAVVGLVAGLLAGRWNLPPVRTAITCAAAYATHFLLDWLGTDTALPHGIMVLWPVSPEYYTSGANVFLRISRRYWSVGEFIIGNLQSLAWELIVLAPIAGMAWWARRRARAGES